MPHPPKVFRCLKMDGPYVKVMKWQPGIVNDALNCGCKSILRKGTSKNIVQFWGVTFELGVIIS